MRRNQIILSAPVIFVVTLAAATLLQSRWSLFWQNSDDDLVKDFKLEDASIKLPPNTIIWAKPKGNYPQFIENDPGKGYGDAELVIKPLINELIKEGIDVDIKTITDAKERWFMQKSGLPVCGYPYVFTKQRLNELKSGIDTRNASVLFQLAETTDVIEFRKEDLAKFKTHLNSSGAIEFERLVNDHSLKIGMVQGV